jgi:prolyl oligopeptidase
LKIYERDGTFISEIKLPALGSVSEITGMRKDDVMHFFFTSFLYPGTIFQYNFKEGKLIALKEAAVNFDVAGYEVKQIFYASKDGTKIPMFIIRRRGTK